MADNPLQPRDNGRMGMPSITPGMNKLGPTASGGGRGDKDDFKRLGGEDREEDEKILERARKRWERADSYESDNRKAALDDLNNYAGIQWPADMAAARQADGRPALTINKFPVLIKQVTNDVRQNRPSINVSPVGDRSDPEVAKMLAGLIREIERKSVADIAYDTAFASSARCGFGFWRVMDDWEKPNSLNKVLTISRIRNAFTVYMDPSAQDPVGADAKWCFITEMMDRSEFRDEYPDADPIPWANGSVGDRYKGWVTKDQIRIAEYYEFEAEKRTYVMLENGVEGWEDKLDEKTKKAFKIIDERESDWLTLWHRKITAVQVLEERMLPLKWIPVLRVCGEEVDLNGKVTYSGLVRHAKDAQRMFNYWRTSYTETVALAPKAPWVMEEGQIEGHEGEWKNANRLPIPVLTYKGTSLGDKLAPPPQRVQPVQPPAGMEVAANDAQQDIMTTTGVRFDATLKERMYDESGRALRELRRFGDLNSFDLVDNLARAQRHTGEILIDWMPHIYSTKRVATILREDDNEEQVLIDPFASQAMGEMRNPRNNKIMKVFNPTIGEYGVAVTIGPSYATKRVEASESMMDFLRAVAPAYPQAVSAIADLVAKNQDWPGAEEVQTRLTRLLAEAHPMLIQQDMRDVPPVVQANIMAMQRQLQQMQQQNAVLTKALNDTNADRQLRAEKNEQDFEAKILAILQKAQASQDSHIGSQIKDLADAFGKLQDALSAPAQGSA